MDEAYETEVRERTTSALALVRQAHSEIDEQITFLKDEAKRLYIEAASVGLTYTAKERHWVFLTKPRTQRTAKQPKAVPQQQYAAAE